MDGLDPASAMTNSVPTPDLMDDPDAIPEKTLCSQAQEPGSSSVSYWRKWGYYTLETERADLLRGLFLN